MNYETVGIWRDTDRQALHAGVGMVAVSLAQVTGLNEITAFDCTFGSVRFILSYSLKYNGYATENRVTFRPGRVTPELVVHELGHIFAIRNLSLITAQSTEILSVRTAAFQPRTQSHPETMPGGELLAEKWAELFQAWVCCSFAQNTYGLTWYGWVEEHMLIWLNEEISPKTRKESNQ